MLITYIRKIYLHFTQEKVAWNYITATLHTLNNIILCLPKDNTLSLKVLFDRSECFIFTECLVVNITLNRRYWWSFSMMCQISGLLACLNFEVQNHKLKVYTALFTFEKKCTCVKNTFLYDLPFLFALHGFAFISLKQMKLVREVCVCNWLRAAYFKNCSVNYKVIKFFRQKLVYLYSETGIQRMQNIVTQSKASGRNKMRIGWIWLKYHIISHWMEGLSGLKQYLA